MQFIDLKTQSKRIENRLQECFNRVLRHGSFIMGPEVFEFEERLKEFLGVKHAISVSSGTDALLIALMAIGIGKGDEVITTPFSFFSTVEVILLLGAKPVFVDINPETYNIDETLIEKAITKNTKAIMPVSLYGQCANLDAIVTIADKYNIKVIEDGAQSFGALHNEKKSLSITHIGCTSFFPSKPLGCFGDGGACFTNDDDLAQAMQEIRIHGQSKRYMHTRLGITGRLDTLQAAILVEKLNIFPEEIELREQVAHNYNVLLGDMVKKQYIENYNTCVYAQYTIEVDDRLRVQQQLMEAGIPTAVHYPLGLHQQKAVLDLLGECPTFIHTEKASKKVLSLPMHPYLKIEEQQFICSNLLEALKTKASVMVLEEVI